MVTLQQLTKQIEFIQEEYDVYAYFKGRGDGSQMLRIEEKKVTIGDGDNGRTNA